MAYRCPVVFICENNFYVMSVTTKKVSTMYDDISKRAIAYGVNGYDVEENDVLSVYEKVS